MSKSFSFKGTVKTVLFFVFLFLVDHHNRETNNNPSKPLHNHLFPTMVHLYNSIEFSGT